MRFSGLVPAAMVFLVPLAGFAQHASAPTPSITSVSSHVSSAPMASSHSSSASSVHSVGVTSAASTQRSHSAAMANRYTNASKSSHENLSKFSQNPRPQRMGFFAFIHRRQDKCRNGSCGQSPTRNLTSEVHAFTPIPSEALLGCRVVPVANSAIPCNAFAPCCP
jgi:hypothetical protein